MKHKNAILFFGIIWAVVGVSLLTTGLKLLTQLDRSAFLVFISPYTGGVEEGGVVLSALGLILGILKGRFVLKKAAFRVIDRIRSLPNPSRFSEIYSFSYFLLVLFMMGLGMLSKYLGIPFEIRAVVDIAVGTALINGSTVYFRSVFVEHYL